MRTRKKFTRLERLDLDIRKMDKAITRADLYDENIKRKSNESVGNLKNRVFDPNDGSFNPENNRSESIDPRMLAYDSGVPQFFLKEALVECNVDGNVNKVTISAGNISITNYKDSTLTRWGIKETPRANYDPTRTWNINQTTFTLATNVGYFLYAKVNIEEGSTACVLEVFDEHREVKLYIEGNFLYYKLGYISATNGTSERHAEMLWGNVKYISPSKIGYRKIYQPDHGFTGQHPIRVDKTLGIWVKAQADSAEHADTMAFVSEVIDIDHFKVAGPGQRISGSWVKGNQYALDPDTAGETIVLVDPEVWNIGEVRQPLGWCDEDGILTIEISVGKVITASPFQNNIVESLSVSNDVLTLVQSLGDDVVMPFPYYTKTELNTSGAGGEVHWDNVTNKPTFPNDIDYVSGVSYSNGILTFSGTGNAFSGDVNIGSSSDYISNVSVNGGSLTFSGVGSAFSGTVTINTYNGWNVNVDGVLKGAVLDGKDVDFIPGNGIDISHTLSAYDHYLTFSHANTSVVPDTSNVGYYAIQNLDFDQFGHVLSTQAVNIPVYSYWRLYENGTNRGGIYDGNSIDFVGGTDIDVTWQSISAGNFRLTFDYTGTGGGVTDHGALNGLGDDDHTQYHNDTRGDIRYYTKTQLQTSGQSSVHWGNLTNEPTVYAQYSITGGGSLSGSLTLNLVNDVASPGIDKYYGTDGTGTRGWYDLPSGGGSDGNDFVTAANFNTGTGLLTLTIPNQTAVTENFDGRYALMNGSYSQYFQVQDLRIGSSTGWKIVNNGTTLEFQYNGVKKAELNSSGEFYAYDSIVY